MEVLQTSRVAAWWRMTRHGSLLLSWADRPLPAADVCSGSWVLQACSRQRGLVVGTSLAAVCVVTYWAGGRLAATLLLLAFVAALRFPVAALAALPTLVLWTPKLGLFGAATDPAFLRIDHAVVAGLTVHLVTGLRYRLRDSALYLPLALYLCLVAVSAAAGVFRGTVAVPEFALAAIAQAGLLALVFVCAYSLGDRLGPTVVYAFALPILAAAAYGLAEWLWPYEGVATGAYRTFERFVFPGQANHMAGVFAIAAVTGLALVSLPRWRTLGVALCVLSLLALITTRSREGVVALGAGLVTLLVVRRPRAGITIMLAGTLGLLLAPALLWERLFDLRGSLYDRLVHWTSAVSTLPQYPWLGIGPGARHRSFYDNQYLMVAAEQGLCALAALLMWLAWVARSLVRRARSPELSGAMAAGALAALGAVLVQSLAAIGLSITVLAGLLFWLMGVALAMEPAE